MIFHYFIDHRKRASSAALALPIFIHTHSDDSFTVRLGSFSLRMPGSLISTNARRCLPSAKFSMINSTNARVRKYVYIRIRALIRSPEKALRDFPLRRVYAIADYGNAAARSRAGNLDLALIDAHSRGLLFIFLFARAVDFFPFFFFFYRHRKSVKRA